MAERKTTSKVSDIGVCQNCEGDMEWVKIDWVCPVCNAINQEKVLRRKAHDNLALPPRLLRHTFENYKDVNLKAGEIKRKCISYAANHQDTGGMIMVGDVGTGKTHLAVAMCKAVCDQGNTAHLTTVPKIIRDVRSSWGANKKTEPTESESQIIRRYATNYVFLVIDEIGSQYGSDSEKIIISEIINDRYNNNLPTVIIGNVSIKEAEDYLGVRVIDRLKENGTVVNFDWESHRRINK